MNYGVSLNSIVNLNNFLTERGIYRQTLHIYIIYIYKYILGEVLIRGNTVMWFNIFGEWEIAKEEEISE